MPVCPPLEELHLLHLTPMRMCTHSLHETLESRQCTVLAAMFLAYVKGSVHGGL